MPRNEEGEFELVIGNRQLLSGFFIVVVLFGVLFAMGYIVGRHSSPTAPGTAAAASGEAAPVASPSSTGPGPGHAEVVMAETKPETPAAETSSAAPATRPATAPPEAPRPAETKPPEPRREPEPRAAGKGPADPPPGRYLQVAAPNRAAADGVVESLKNKGIHAVLAPGPNADTVRVLVGPLDPANVGKMKVDLEAAGFKPFNKNY